MPAPPLAGCYVISLRPVGAHASLRRAAAAQGARLLALSPWRLVPRDDAATRASLDDALAAPRVLFTSPAAVRMALRLQPLVAVASRQVFAVGAGTAAALRRAGVATVAAPARMDSEGRLALPGLQLLAGTSVGLVTAPGGRGEIVQVLQQRGARVLRANVYERVAIAPSSRALAALRALDAPAWLALSSGAALETLLAALPGDAVAVLRRARVVAASARLAQLARGHGFTGDAVIADSARPRDLVAAAVAGVSHPLAWTSPLDAELP
jgi:uroporphyrinogen-III synthase